MHIAPASVADASTLAALHQACFDRGWSEKEFAVFFERDGIIGFIAYDESRAVGFIFCWVVAGESELLAMGVLEDYRKQGVAHQLLGQALKRCDDLGAATMHLEVGLSNEAAQALYARHGFEITGRRVGYYHAPDGTLEDALTMTRQFSIPF